MKVTGANLHNSVTRIAYALYQTRFDTVAFSIAQLSQTYAFSSIQNYVASIIPFHQMHDFETPVLLHALITKLSLELNEGSLNYPIENLLFRHISSVVSMKHYGFSGTLP